MSSWSFYDLTPANDHALARPMLPEPSLTPEEDAAEEKLFLDLMETLEAALDAYSDLHPELTYGTCIMAAECLTHMLKKEHDAERADA